MAQNFANQLAQMAVGQEAMFLGSALNGEPSEGLIEIDVLSESAMVNGRLARLTLAGALHQWVEGELARKKLDATWLEGALVKIRYRRDGGGAAFDALAVVRTGAGVMKGEFSNSQALVGAWLRRTG